MQAEWLCYQKTCLQPTRLKWRFIFQRNSTLSPVTANYFLRSCQRHLLLDRWRGWLWRVWVFEKRGWSVGVGSWRSFVAWGQGTNRFWSVAAYVACGDATWRWGEWETAANGLFWSGEADTVAWIEKTEEWVAGCTTARHSWEEHELGGEVGREETILPQPHVWPHFRQ